MSNIQTCRLTPFWLKLGELERQFGFEILAIARIAELGKGNSLLELEAVPQPVEGGRRLVLALPAFVHQLV
jgi:hypothetical protein